MFLGKKGRPTLFKAWVGLAGGWMGAATAWAAPAPITITLLHTNDVHSHFRSEATPLQLGGIARLRTVIKKARAQSPDSLLVDGGDWSEGQIYYVADGGAESLRMMDMLGYDAAVVGNHDWLNGPDTLLAAIQKIHPRTTLVGANFEMNGYASAAKFYSAIAPYALKEVRGVKIAFVGLANFDPLYAPFLAPVTTVDPAAAAEKYAAQLKSQHLADIVVGISHNSITANEAVLQAAPDLDLIIGAHDHVKLLHPHIVARPGRPDAWVVEAGKWGEYLGQVKLEFTPGTPSTASVLKLQDYALTQVDLNSEEDPDVKKRVDWLEERIEAKFGPIFHDPVAHSDDEVMGDTLESPIGNLVTDAYRRTTGADIALDQNRLIYDGLHAGDLHSADVFNALPPIYNFRTGRAWTLSTWTMSGSMVSLLFRIMYTWSKLTDNGGMSFSGFELIYDPLVQKSTFKLTDIFETIFGSNDNSPVHLMRINGEPINFQKNYKITASSGIVETLQAFNAKYYNVLALRDLDSTGIEDWKIVRDDLRSQKVIKPESVSLGRVRTWQSDLGIVPGSFRWTPVSKLPDGSMLAHVQVSVANYGGSPSAESGSFVDLSSNEHGYDGSVDPVWTNRGAGRPIPSLYPDEVQTFSWDEVTVPESRGLYPLSAYVHTVGETNRTNDGLTREFRPANP